MNLAEPERVFGSFKDYGNAMLIFDVGQKSTGVAKLEGVEYNISVDEIRYGSIHHCEWLNKESHTTEEIIDRISHMVQTLSVGAFAFGHSVLYPRHPQKFQGILERMEKVKDNIKCINDIIASFVKDLEDSRMFDGMLYCFVDEFGTTTRAEEHVHQMNPELRKKNKDGNWEYKDYPEWKRLVDMTAACMIGEILQEYSNMMYTIFPNRWENVVRGRLRPTTKLCVKGVRSSYDVLSAFENYKVLNFHENGPKSFIVTLSSIREAATALQTMQGSVVESCLEDMVEPEDIVRLRITYH